MAEGTNRDVVAARIKLDTGTVLQSFKNIDTGAKGNADAFKALNAELSSAEKSYKNISSAMDKMALTADQRRQKILAEVEAQHKQKLAQTALLGARAQQLEQTNRLIDAKMQAQQALIKRRNQQIEQSEREHQQKMQILQNRSVKTGQEAAKATGTGTDDRTRERVLQEEQKIRMALTERQRKEEALREKVLQEEQRIRQALSQTEQQTKRMGSTMDAVSKSWIGRIGDMASHAVVFHTMYKAMHEVTQAMKEGLVDIESNMAGYVQTNEHYFVHFEDGTNKMVMDTQKLNRETKAFIQTAHELGSNILDVTESARLWGRMYKDVNVVQELVRQSTKLSTVDMVELEDATKSMESVMSQYGVHISNANDAMVIGNRVLDSWSKVAHDTMAPARDLGAAFQRTGKIAAETGVSFDVMNGLISSGVRNTALSGENLGNMWKTVLGTIRTDKAVDEIERLGVKTKEVVDGVEQWRKAEDILLDLSIQV
ncbi:SPBc2 prophage-derived transglycosylase, partial [Paenibacillus sp. FSL R5-192]|uniref:phage tail tape measure protein n=1 Tax=Paenibacillus sp. FSL R5-192 TaxID=1226754 RepID=UPI0003E2BC75